MTFATSALRRIARRVNGGTPTANEANWGGDVPWATPVDLGEHHGRRILSTGRTLSSEGLESGSSLVPAGSVIVSTRAPIGYVAVAGTPMAFNQGCRALIPADHIDPAFLAYAMQAMLPEMEARGTGTTFMEISSGTMATIPVPNPQPAMQRRVVAFLDWETAQIDAVIAKQEELVDLLDERVWALILSATLGNRESSTPKRLGRAVAKMARPAGSGLEVVTAYRDGVVTRRSLRREEGYTFSDTEAGYQGVERGDLVFHALDGFARAVGVAQARGVSSPVYHVCRMRDGDERFMAYHLRAAGRTGLLTAYAWSVRERSVDYRNWSLFASLPASLPSHGVQSRVADDLDRQIATMRTIQQKARESIQLMRERRAALISDAVTGQLDIDTYGEGAA